MSIVTYFVPLVEVLAIYRLQTNALRGIVLWNILSEILYNHTLPNSILLKTEYLTALIARIKLYVLCGLFSYQKKFFKFFCSS